MGKNMFTPPKPKSPPASPAATIPQAVTPTTPAAAQATELAQRDLAEEQRRATAEREAFQRGLRGNRALLSPAGEAGFTLPTRLGGA